MSYKPVRARTGSALNENRQDIIEFGVNKKHDPLNIFFDLNKVQTPHTILVSDLYTKTLTHQKRKDSGSCDKQWLKINERENIVFFKNQDSNNLCHLIQNFQKS